MGLMQDFAVVIVENGAEVLQSFEQWCQSALEGIIRSLV